MCNFMCLAGGDVYVLVQAEMRIKLFFANHLLGMLCHFEM